MQSTIAISGVLTSGFSELKLPVASPCIVDDSSAVRIEFGENLRSVELISDLPEIATSAGHLPKVVLSSFKPLDASYNLLKPSDATKTQCGVIRSSATFNSSPVISAAIVAVDDNAAATAGAATVILESMESFKDKLQSSEATIAHSSEQIPNVECLGNVQCAIASGEVHLPHSVKQKSIALPVRRSIDKGKGVIIDEEPSHRGKIFSPPTDVLTGTQFISPGNNGGVAMVHSTRVQDAINRQDKGKRVVTFSPTLER